MRAILLLSISLSCLQSINSQQKYTRQSSIDAFLKGDLEEAYKGFTELLEMYPRDPLYKYYSGVCLVKLEKNPVEALALLEQAHGGSSVVRSIPGDLLFWLGRARQMTGDYEKAIEAFDGYTLQFGKKAAKDLDVPAYIQQCREQKGQITAVTQISAGEAPSEKTVKEIVTIRPTTVTEIVSGGNIKNDTVPGDFDTLLAEALQNQFRADSLYRISDHLNGELDKLDYRKKTELRQRIAEIEALAADYQKKADVKYNQAQMSMNKSSFAEIKIPVAEAVPEPDSVKKVIDEAVISPDTVPQKEIISKPPEMIEKQVEILNVFEVVPADENSTEPLRVNAPVPPGLIYRLQLAVFRNPVSRSYFKGITPVYGFKLPENNYTTYYAGMFRQLAEARVALNVVKQKGFRDAFIAALAGGKSISMERAAVLEKEWGNKPFMITKMAPLMPADTIPPELCLRVEVLRSPKPLKQDVTDNIRQVAGTRGFDIETAADGTTIYLIGKFITWESASSYADLLVRNGYRDAKVVARLGKKEVPVETAKTLFEQIE